MKTGVERMNRTIESFHYDDRRQFEAHLIVVAVCDSPRQEISRELTSCRFICKCRN